jgi:Domain of unknown function (DUF5134)
MPAWLGVTLTMAFVLVAVHRTVWRDAPGALMAVGMAVMSLGMAGIGPMLVSGPWWALVFVLVAVWPVVRPMVAPVLRPALARVPLLGTDPAGPVCGGPLAHLLGGVAMVYMCALPIAGAMAGMSEPTDGAALTAHASRLPAMSGMGGGTPPGLATAAASTPLALVGWALACYFLLGTITALTRRGPAGAPSSPRSTLFGADARSAGASLGEAVMGFGTVIMLVAMT